MSEASFVGATLDQAQLAGAVLLNANFHAASLRSVDLSDQTIRLNTLFHSDLTGSNLSGTDLANQNLGRASLRASDLSGTNLTGTYLQEADLWTCLLYTSPSPRDR